ncbi:hypothetical protein JCM11491_007130 [Sporobolomyces phaffii]
MPKSGPQGTNERALAVKPSVPHLPDEIILFIYQLLHQDLRNEKLLPGEAGSLLASRPELLRLNKRFYRLLRPVWFSILSTKTAKMTDSALATLLRQPETASHVRVLSLTVDASIRQTHYAALSHLPHLLTLQLRLKPDHAAASTSASTSMLQLVPLTNLHNLEIFSHDPRIDFPHMSTTFPSLTSLTLPYHARSGSQLALGDWPPTLRTFRLVCIKSEQFHEHEWDSRSWSKLQVVEIGAVSRGQGSGPGPKSLVEAFQLAWFPEPLEYDHRMAWPQGFTMSPVSFSLRRIALDFKIQAVSNDFFDLQDLRDLLILVRYMHIERLRINVDPSPTAGMWDVLPTVRSIVALEIYGSICLGDKVARQILYDIVRCFPSLRLLQLKDASLFESAEQRPRGSVITTTMDDAGVWLAFPELGALLLYIEKKTRILEVLHPEGIDGRVVKWHRPTASDELVREHYKKW